MTALTCDAVRWLRTSTLHAGIDTSTGALVALERPNGWQLLDRPALGRSFQLLIPLDGRRNNVVDGRAQNTPEVEVGEDGNTITCMWNGVRSAHGGVHDVTVRTRSRMIDDRLVFEIDIDNRSQHTIEGVHFPYLGDVRPPHQDSQVEAFSYQYASAHCSPIWPHFANMPGYYGFDHPTFQVTVGAPAVPFVLLQDGQQGLYLGVDTPSSELVSWTGGLVPGWADSLESQVPSTDTIAGQDVAIRFAAVHVPYVLPGEQRTLTPVMMAAFDGDWQAGADVYVARRGSWHMPTAPGPAWTREPHSWLQIHVNSPEDELRWTFDTLPAIAQECHDRGVSAIQLVGWNDGGQDQNNPSHDADERLGGAAMLARAIKACQEIGVRIVLFTKFTWADRATERFREELIREAVKDPYGDYYMHPGYRYQTITQLLDINTKRLIPMCFGSERYLEICREEFQKVLDLGADGMLFDEALHHGPALLCFDRDHGHRYADPVYSHDREFVAHLRQIGDPVAPEFLYAAEAAYDWELEAYQLSYHRSEDPQHLPLSRYLRPDATLMTAVTGFDDRNMINQCLLYRYVISYEPLNFKGRLPDFPQTVAYGTQMDQLRGQLREWLWDAQFQGTIGARVRTAAGAEHHPYTVFRHQDGRTAVVVANYLHDRQEMITISVADGIGPRRYRLVEDNTWHDATDGIILPPRCAAVVLPG